MFKIAQFLVAGLASSFGIGYVDQLPAMEVVRGGGGWTPRHRSPGDRAHKRWKRARASGRR